MCGSVHSYKVVEIFSGAIMINCNGILAVSAPLELFHGDSRVQIIVLATVAIVLLLALVASAITYFICWRIQVRLIGRPLSRKQSWKSTPIEKKLRISLLTHRSFIEYCIYPEKECYPRILIIRAWGENTIWFCDCQSGKIDSMYSEHNIYL